MAVATVTLQSAAAATGNGTAINFDTPGYMTPATVRLQVQGTFVGTVTYEGSVDGTNYAAVVATDASATSTGEEILQFDVRGLALFRARVSAYTSGAINVTARVVSEFD